MTGTGGDQEMLLGPPRIARDTETVIQDVSQIVVRFFQPARRSAREELQGAVGALSDTHAVQEHHAQEVLRLRVPRLCSSLQADRGFRILSAAEQLNALLELPLALLRHHPLPQAASRCEARHGRVY